MELRHQLTVIWRAWVEEFEGRVVEDENGERFEEPRIDFPTDNSLLEHLERMPVSDVVEAVRIAAWRWRRRDDPIYGQSVVRYFHGVCRNRARRREEERRQIHVTWDELAIALPALMTLYTEIEGFSPAKPWFFCGDALWKQGWQVNFPGGASQKVASPVATIAGLLGPKSENARHPILGTQTAYDLAIRTIHAAVPPCGQTCACRRPKRAPREEDYPRCEWCQTPYAPLDRRESCVPSVMTWRGREYASVPYGQEGWVLTCEIAENYGRYKRLREPRIPAIPARCGDCRTPIGGEHHHGCAARACYVCGDRPGSRCAQRNHMATNLGMSAKQAMARLRHMGPRNESARRPTSD